MSKMLYWDKEYIPRNRSWFLFLSSFFSSHAWLFSAYAAHDVGASAPAACANGASACAACAASAASAAAGVGHHVSP